MKNYGRRSRYSDYYEVSNANARVNKHFPQDLDRYSYSSNASFQERVEDYMSRRSISLDRLLLGI